MAWVFTWAIVTSPKRKEKAFFGALWNSVLGAVESVRYTWYLSCLSCRVWEDPRRAKGTCKYLNSPTRCKFKTWVPIKDTFSVVLIPLTPNPLRDENFTRWLHRQLLPPSSRFCPDLPLPYATAGNHFTFLPGFPNSSLRAPAPGGGVRGPWQNAKNQDNRVGFFLQSQIYSIEKTILNSETPPPTPFGH